LHTTGDAAETSMARPSVAERFIRARRLEESASVSAAAGVEVACGERMSKRSGGDFRMG
jgi:hypothetical protein